MVVVSIGVRLVNVQITVVKLDREINIGGGNMSYMNPQRYKNGDKSVN